MPEPEPLQHLCIAKQVEVVKLLKVKLAYGIQIKLNKVLKARQILLKLNSPRKFAKGCQKEKCGGKKVAGISSSKAATQQTLGQPLHCISACQQ